MGGFLRVRELHIMLGGGARFGRTFAAWSSLSARNESKSCDNFNSCRRRGQVDGPPQH